MKLSSMLHRDLIFLDSDLTDVSDIIDYCSKEMASVFELDYHKIKEVLLQREKLSSTAVGDNLMLPHGKLTEFNDLIISFVRLKNEITVNDLPVKYVFVIISGIQNAHLYLQTLSAISKLVVSDKDILNSTDDIEEFYNLVSALDIKITDYLTAKDIMTKPYIVSSNEKVAIALDLMKEHNFSFLPVVDDEKKIVGCIDFPKYLKTNLPDYIFHLQSFSFIGEFKPIENLWKSESEKSISTCMEDYKNIIVKENSGYAEVLFLMAKHSVNHLIVINDQKKVVGVISSKDIIHKIIRA